MRWSRSPIQDQVAYNQLVPNMLNASSTTSYNLVIEYAYEPYYFIQ